MGRITLLLASLTLTGTIQAATVYTERLALTGQVWGYLKYHHSGTCQVDWDQALLDAVAAQSGDDSEQGFNGVIRRLITAAGQNQPSSNSIPVLQPGQRIGSELDWMDDLRLSVENRAAIGNVAQSFRPFQSCHVSPSPVGVPRFENDAERYSQTSTNFGERMLAIFRFWNIINYFFPYKPLMDSDWSAVLLQTVERMQGIDRERDYHLLVREMSAKIDDTHGYFVSPLFEQFLGGRYTPFRMELIQGKSIVTRAQAATVLQVGDEIISLDGVPIEQQRRALAPYIAASNPVTEAYYAHRYLERGFRATVEVEYRRGSSVQQATVPRAPENRQFITNFVGVPVNRYTQPDCDLGYVNMGLVFPEDIDAIMDDFSDTDGIIFDLRNYPNSTVWTLVNYLYPGPVDVALFESPRTDYPGTTEQILGRIGRGSRSPYDGRVLILFNEETLSQAEYTVMALEQHPRAVKIGSQTQAADGEITQMFLPGGLSVYMTGLGVYTPEGGQTQRIGMVPDVYVTPTIEGVRSGTDELLQVALDCARVTDDQWPTAPSHQSAIYFDPDRQGHGFDLSNAGSTTVLVNYTYRADGTPVWYLATGGSADGVFRLDHDSYAQYQYDFAQRSTTQTLVAGAGFDLDFQSGRQSIQCAVEDPSSRQSAASLLWQQEDQRAQWCPQAFVFDPAASTADNPDGLWYAGEADQGWGMTVRRQGQTLFVVLYYYNQSGAARWATGSAVVSDQWPQDGPVQLPLIETQGYCFSCDRQSIQSTEIGVMDLSIGAPSQRLDSGNWVSIHATAVGDDQAWTRQDTPIRLLSDVLGHGTP